MIGSTSTDSFDYTSFSTGFESISRNMRLEESLFSDVKGLKPVWTKKEMPVRMIPKSMSAPTIDPERICKFLERLLRERFYGVIEIHCENGRIYRVRKLHNIMKEELERLTNS